MPDQAHVNRPHFILHNTASARAFKARGAGGEAHTVPALPRQQHGASLQRQMAELKPVAAKAARTQQEMHLESGFGLQIQFASQVGVELAFESLANAPRKIELLSIRHEGEQTFANVFVPDGQLAHFETYIADYLQEKTDRNGRPRDHRILLDAIQSIRAAEIKELWTDEPKLLPATPDFAFWWEVWLRKGASVVEDFKKIARLAGCTVLDQEVSFPERIVLLMRGSQQQLTKSRLALNSIAELRLAKETAEFFDEMGVDEQREWVDEVLHRTQFRPDTVKVPRIRICLLDSGVARAHPLLAPLMDPHDLHTVNPNWGSDDNINHGTGQAGLAAYGDLTEVLASAHPVTVSHRLESVKLIDQQGANTNNAQHHAYLFMDAVARPEIHAPQRPRVFASAVTASDNRDRGRPSAWSAKVDDLAAATDRSGEATRLFILCAGNTTSPQAWANYPDSLSTNLVHDPGQAWNAITVGACTDKINTQGHPFLSPIAQPGELSPYTTTTQAWNPAWPLKTDVVLEGGNAAKDNLGAVSMSSLHLLTTNNDIQTRLFTTSNATSAASALCARMAAQIMAAYPRLRAETVRALLVHSAQWSQTMRAMYLPAKKSPNKQDYVRLIRHCGWGTPNVHRALWSAADSLTLLIEDMLHPYQKVQGKGIETRDMNLHALPWPKDELEALQDTPVEMRITLSYFVEPNPSARGSQSKYHYPSHRLRFDVQRPLESTEDFIARINAAAQREDDGDGGSSSDSDWLLGERQRHRGSLHQDVWTGTAAQLANRGFIAVYPAAGWWRTRPALERYALPARYSLVVSIQTQQTKIDLYAAIAQKIPVDAAVAVTV